VLLLDQLDPTTPGETLSKNINIRMKVYMLYLGRVGTDPSDVVD